MKEYNSAEELSDLKKKPVAFGKASVPLAQFSPRAISGSTTQSAALSSPGGPITIEFEGCFQCRLSTDPAPSNAGNPTSGWTRTFGETNFDRIIRFSSPVAIRTLLYRPWADVIVTNVVAPSIPNPNSDPIIGQSVNLGASTYYNGGPTVPPGFEPLANFMIKIGTNSLSAQTSIPPTGGGVLTLSGAEEAAAGINPELMFANKIASLSGARLAMLLSGGGAIQTYASFCYGLDSSGHHTKPDGPGIVDYYADYPGTLDTNITINPGSSVVLSNLLGQPVLYLKMKLFGFDGDTLVGQVRGMISNAQIP